ncbi:MAG: acyltransferase [Acidobacteriota bacterium]|nr:acyltransferase [Acidobacteriota bacterium]
MSVFGAPIIDRYPGSRIVLGKRVMLISDAFATALGVNHPVVLRTLAAGAEIRIGDRVGISGGSICAALRVEIGDESLLGANVTIADTDFHSLAPGRRSGDGCGTAASAGVRIGRRVFLGTNSMVLKGVSIGDNSVIGAGSVVTRDIPANCIAAGNPCRKLRDLSAGELRGL